jgi:hypothetical protein
MNNVKNFSRERKARKNLKQSQVSISTYKIEFSLHDDVVKL